MRQPQGETVISARASVRTLQALRDLAAYRELFLAFLERDLKVRYKQTALGVLWVVAQPLVTGAVFAAVFGLATGRFGGAEGLLFFMAGLTPWTCFQNGVQMASGSLESNANLLSKVYFPRLVVPGAYVLGSVADFLISFAALLAVAAIAGRFQPLLLLAAPPLLLLQTMAACGAGFFFAALNAQYRDVKYAIPFLLQTGMLVTVLSPLGEWRAKAPLLAEALSWNPMAAVVESYRAILAGGAPDALLLARGAAMALLMLVLGTRFFLARERRLADVL